MSRYTITALLICVAEIVWGQTTQTPSTSPCFRTNYRQLVSYHLCTTNTPAGAVGDKLVRSPEEDLGGQVPAKFAAEGAGYF
jgi:hypothetical protein